MLDTQRAQLKDYIDNSLTQKWIRPSSSRITSAVHRATKKDRKPRICIDFCQLNTLTISDMYPLPLITSVLHEIRKHNFFTKIDLLNAYYQIRVKEGREYLTAFRTPRGTIEYQVMPFGMCNSSACFQRVINTTLW
jgi:Reverse transcriptase (RNA-dependent DNA polymerase)